MYARVLTDFERRKVRTYIGKDGEMPLTVDMLVKKTRKHLPKIRRDFVLLEKLLATYERNKAR